MLHTTRQAHHHSKVVAFRVTTRADDDSTSASLTQSCRHRRCAQGVDRGWKRHGKSYGMRCGVFGKFFRHVFPDINMHHLWVHGDAKSGSFEIVRGENDICGPLQTPRVVLGCLVCRPLSHRLCRFTSPNTPIENTAQTVTGVTLMQLTDCQKLPHFSCLSVTSGSRPLKTARSTPVAVHT